jgi:hypothetical protein
MHQQVHNLLDKTIAKTPFSEKGWVSGGFPEKPLSLLIMRQWAVLRDRSPLNKASSSAIRLYSCFVSRGRSLASPACRISLCWSVPARTVLHTAEAALRPLLNGVQTQEQLDAFIHNLEQLRSVFNNIINCMTRLKRTRGTTSENEAREGIRDPPVHNPKGRPRTRRLTGPKKGRPRGGGARAGAGPVKKTSRLCSECHRSGHNRATCPKKMS